MKLRHHMMVSAAASRQRGFSLIEMLGALGIGSLMITGVGILINNALEDTRGQQTSLYQAQVARAAEKYIRANEGTLAGSATASVPAVVDLATLKSAGLLSAGFSATNAYGQTPCVLVLQPAAGKLQALVVTEGGTEIPAKEAAFVAANSGDGAGYIPAASPTVAQGAFGSWSLALTTFTSRNCSGAAAGAGHLATAKFFDGQDASFDYLYRSAVPGLPELNRMNTPLHMAAQAVEDSSDALCVVGDTTTYGRIAVNANGKVLSCQSGIWKGGSSYWREPVADFASLPTSSNGVGDVRLASSLSRAFSWNGTGWVPLAVDENGNLTVPGSVTAGRVALTEVGVKGAACTPDGAMVRDAAGLPLSCETGFWRSLLETRLTDTALDTEVTWTPADGPQELSVDLTALPGSRPLYLTGYFYCASLENVRSYAVIVYKDAAGKDLGWAGGCGARSDSGGSRVMSKSAIALQKVPENATRLRIAIEPGSVSGDYVEMRLVAKNSN